MEDLNLLLNRAYFYLKFRPRTIKEMRDYLYQKIKGKHWSQDDAETIIKTLKEERLLNDVEFIKWFVRERSILKPKSEFALKRELSRFGVSKNLIDEYFSQHQLNEDKLAEKSLRGKWARLATLDKKKRFGKAASFLARRGFSFDLIKKTISLMEDNN